MSLGEHEAGPSLSETYYTTESEGLAMLGRGKYSVVHKTCRRADNLPVALKTIQIFEMGSKERHECMNEIRLLQQMQHPHIIRYLDCKMERNELSLKNEALQQQLAHVSVRIRAPRRAARVPSNAPPFARVAGSRVRPSDRGTRCAQPQERHARGAARTSERRPSRRESA